MSDPMVVGASADVACIGADVVCIGTDVVSIGDDVLGIGDDVIHPIGNIMRKHRQA